MPKGKRKVDGARMTPARMPSVVSSPMMPLSDRNPMRGVRGYLTVLNIIAERASIRNVRPCRCRSR